MVRIQHTIIIKSSTETVFGALIDFNNTTRWQPQVIEERIIPAGSSLSIGSKIYQARTFMGQRIESTTDVVEYEPDHKLLTLSEPGVFPAVSTTYLVTPIDGGAQLTFFIELTNKGIGWMIGTPIIKFVLQKDVVTRFQTLKNQLETTVQDKEKDKEK